MYRKSVPGKKQDLFPITAATS